jgi:hypothetical protein
MYLNLKHFLRIKKNIRVYGLQFRVCMQYPEFDDKNYVKYNLKFFFMFNLSKIFKIYLKTIL